jgi:hypothetical protein
MKKIQSIFILFLAIGLTSCEDVIDITLEQGPTLLVVDGRITDEPGVSHVIRLTTTAPYFNNSATPAVSAAQVVVETYDSLGTLINIDTLQESTSNPGDYLTQSTVGLLGHRYVLKVQALGENYTSESTIMRIPPIDSITYEFREAVGPFDAGYFIAYNGPEPAGVGDNYLFIIYRNGVRYDAPNEIYFASDELVDGNYIGNLDITPEPMSLGDTITCESYTTSLDQYRFLLELSTQVNNGGIFASPPANVRTNIRNVNPQGPKAVGYFSANAIQRKTVVIQ